MNVPSYVKDFRKKKKKEDIYFMAVEKGEYYVDAPNNVHIPLTEWYRHHDDLDLIEFTTEYE